MRAQLHIVWTGDEAGQNEYGTWGTGTPRDSGMHTEPPRTPGQHRAGAVSELGQTRVYCLPFQGVPALEAFGLHLGLPSSACAFRLEGGVPTLGIKELGNGPAEGVTDRLFQNTFGCGLGPDRANDCHQTAAVLGKLRALQPSASSAVGDTG
ncbi:hypothetical protein [Streptomyces sp. NPDC055005]